MTHFFKKGAIFSVSGREASEIYDLLPAGNYVLKYSQMSGFFLEHVEDFEKPSKIYGDAIQNTDRILSTFLQRPAATGVLLSGEKGSGKTLLAKMLSITAAEQKQIPTIIINTPYTGDDFFTFIQSIEQPVIIQFDEFEKVYSEDEHQKSILTLFDGVFPTKKLFILTVNESWKVSEYMKNRPGRLYYNITFNGLSDAFIREYCEDVLIQKEHIDTIVRLTTLFKAFNFDMLKAMVEEMNRYGESPTDVLKLLNVRPSSEDSMEYDVLVAYKGIVIPKDFARPNNCGRNPLLVKEFSVNYNLQYVFGSDDDDDEDDNVPVSEETANRKTKQRVVPLPDWNNTSLYVPQSAEDFANILRHRSLPSRDNVTLCAKDFVKTESASDTIVFAKDGWVVTFKRKAVYHYDFDAF